MPTYRDTLPLDSPWIEKCARHQAPHTARTLQHIYLCDSCARRLVHEALNDRPFVYHGETIDGYCGLCNRRTAVTLRQHFACTQCWALITSYQKGYVSAAAVHAMWSRDIAPHHPYLELSETDVLRLEPYVRNKTTKSKAAETLTTLDFLVLDAGSPRFHIELKTGPMSVTDMNEFQLDVNDFDDIIGASCFTGLPSYIFHVQMGMRYEPPTRELVSLGMWWTDFRRLRDHLVGLRKRRNEDKYAGYFNTDAFHPIETFSAEIARKGYNDLRSHLVPEQLALPAPGTKIPRTLAAKKPARPRKKE